MSFIAFDLLIIAWVLDGGFRQLKYILKDPFIQAILFLCLVVGLGILWSDDIESGYNVFKRYMMFLVFIPYLCLLNKERLPWAIAGVAIGCLFVLVIGSYYVFALEEQWFLRLKMHYLTFSLMVGIGIILALYYAGQSQNIKIQVALWLTVFALMYLQFNLNGRGPLIATVLTEILLLFLMYREKPKQLLSFSAMLIIAVTTFSSGSDVFHQRVALAKDSIDSIQAGNHATSIGYRAADIDVGLHGISQRPVFGHGTGMSVSYFEKTIPTYKDGLYKELTKFIKPTSDYHYHNEWIDLGLNIGLLGIISFIFLLWAWYQTMKKHNLSTMGVALVCYVFLIGQTNLIVHERKALFLLLIITAITIAYQKNNPEEGNDEVLR